jgi:hypothetical protein
MRKKIIAAAWASLAFTTTQADSPGKKQMHDSKVSFQNVKQLAGYTLYYDFHYGDKNGIVTTDTSLVIPSSGGAPDGFICWAINNSTQKSTDTINFRNYYAPDEVVLLSGIKNDSIVYSKLELSNKNEIVNTKDTSRISNKALVKEAAAVKRNHYYKITAYIIAAVIALVALIWYFIKRKKKSAV